MGAGPARPPEPRRGQTGLGLTRRVAGLAISALILGGCGASSPVAKSGRAQDSVSSARATSTPSITQTAYCDPKDTTIPGAAAALAGEQALPNGLSAVQQAWLQMDASMVPACSEVVPDPPSVELSNLTNGLVSSAAFDTWLEADEETLTLIEWAQQHNQPYLIQALHWGPGVSSFVASGGRVVDDRTCEYSEKADAVSVTGVQMSDLTSGGSSTSGVAYAQATVGPCSTQWISADGTVTTHNLGAGSEGVELDVTTMRSNPAVGPYLAFVVSLDEGFDPTVDAILSEIGI